MKERGIIMAKRECLHKECRKIYDVESPATDDGYCSFECWENDNCHTPEEVISEEFAD
jgi:hypothetical protein